MNQMTLDSAPEKSTEQSLAEAQKPYISPSEASIEYRSISTAAIAGCVFAILGLLAFWSVIFVVLPVLAIAFGLISLLNIRRFPHELTGKLPAKIALFVGLASVVGASAFHAIIFATEVPEGYQRISFYDLKPKSREMRAFPEKAELLDGQKVFLKGYVRTSDRQYDLKNFIMVGDLGSCCFGGSPKITDVVAVKILIDDSVNSGIGLRRIGGTFRLNREPQPTSEKDIPKIIYEIEADYVR